VRSRGLTEGEATRRLAEQGPNSVPHPPPPGVTRRVAVQLRDPMILLLLGALVVVVLIGDLSDAAIIAAVVVLNTTIGVVQELRAEHAIAALDRLAAPRARVVREGRVREVDAAELVVGDVVRLDAGDVVPADLSLLEAVGVEVDEAAMTGESVPVARLQGEELLAGTVVTRGRAVGGVARTGPDSGLGRIATLIAGTEKRATPLQRRLNRLSRQLVVGTTVLCLGVVALSLARGGGLVDSVILAVSLAVAAIPESLPAVVSVALAMGAYRMARHSALVRWLPAVETLGSVTVLASDKTGTLTEGRMAVQVLWSEGTTWLVGGPRPDPDTRWERLLRDIVLCNDAVLPLDEAGRPVGDPLEVALLVAASEGGVTSGDLRRSWTRVEETPFASERQWMSTIDQHRTGGRLEVVKGGPEAVWRLLAGGTPDAPAEDPHDARTTAERLAADGFRMLAVADRTDPGTPFELVGLVGIADPPRAGARDVVKACADAGIRVILVTGDHPATARAIAGAVGIATGDAGVADGAAVERGEHVDRVAEISVYARTRPEQKVDIVSAWQARGDVVAMTGDGVNDAPALRSADIGVAMGDRGTEVARQAADLVLADDDLRTVVRAVAEGRRIYANIRAFLRYGLSGGLAEVLVILVAPLLGLPLPLTPAQILWINMLTHGIPGVAFGGEPLDPDLMRRPSPSPERSVLGQGLARQVAWTAGLIAAVSLGAGLVVEEDGTGAVRTAVFFSLGCAQLALALALRSPRDGVDLAHRGLEAAVLASLVGQVLAVTWAPLRALLGTEALSWSAQGALLAVALVPAAVTVGVRRMAARRRPGAEHDGARRP
jgi:Ca2+-transporting ATPase